MVNVLTLSDSWTHHAFSGPELRRDWSRVPFSVSLDAFIWEFLMAPDSIPRGRGTMQRQANKTWNNQALASNWLAITLMLFFQKTFSHIESVISIEFNKTPNAWPSLQKIAPNIGSRCEHFLPCHPLEEYFFHEVVKQFWWVLKVTLGENEAHIFFYSMRKTLNNSGIRCKSPTISVRHKITSIEFNHHRQTCPPRPRIDA